MNAIKYLRNRFEFAVNGNGSIKVNNNDIEAINKLIEDNGKPNTDLEDSLLLFYLLWTYRVENENNQAVLKQKDISKINFPLGLSEATDVLNHLSKLLDPKDYVIKKIHEELRIYQEYERLKDKQPIDKDKRIKLKEVRELIEETLNHAKNEFPKINKLKAGVIWKS